QKNSDRRLRFRLGNELPDMSMFEITLNGQRRTLPEAISVLQLLRQLGYETPRGVAVEVNREVVPAIRHAERRLAAGDAVEVTTLVGGGEPTPDKDLRIG